MKKTGIKVFFKLLSLLLFFLFLLSSPLHLNRFYIHLHHLFLIVLPFIKFIYIYIFFLKIRMNTYGHRYDSYAYSEKYDSIFDFSVCRCDNDNSIFHFPSAGAEADKKVTPFAILMSVPQGPALATPFMDSAPPPVPQGLCADLEHYTLCAEDDESAWGNEQPPAPTAAEDVFSECPDFNWTTKVRGCNTVGALDNPFNFDFDEGLSSDFSDLSISLEFAKVHPATVVENEEGGGEEEGNCIYGSSVFPLSFQKSDERVCFSESPESACSASAAQSASTTSPLCVPPQHPSVLSPSTSSSSSTSISPSVSPSFQQQQHQRDTPSLSPREFPSLSQLQKYNFQPNTQTTSPPPPTTAGLSIPINDATPVVLDESQPFEHFLGRIYGLCQDQAGCRYLQKKLDEGDPQVTSAIYAETLPHATALMTDPFGNYLFQKLLKCCSGEQRGALLQRVSGDLVAVSLNVHGTRAVQRVVDVAHGAAEVGVLRRAFRGHIVELIQDPNGNHVIQRCLHALPAADSQFIYDEVTAGENMVRVATHRHGCCVIQRCVDLASGAQKLQVVENVVEHALTLVQDPFGNYVVQYVLDLGVAGVPGRIAGRLRGHFVDLSTQKFSSNVVEKIMQADGGEDAVEAIVAEIVACDKIDALLQDPYANYVIQTALTRASDRQHKELSGAILGHISVLRNTPYGKRIQAKMYRDSHPAVSSSPYLP